MKTIKVTWTEREVIEYGYEDEIEVEDDFVVNTEHLIDRILGKINNYGSYDSISTNYEPIPYFQDPETGEIKIKEFEIDAYVEITPPPIEEKKIEYLQLLKEMDLKIDGMKFEKERIEKLLTELK